MTGTTSPETSVSKTASSTAFTRAPFKAAPLKLTPADPANCKISDNMADCCKTRCEVCGKTFSLVNMRSHTLSAHKMRITKYKEVYGPLNLLEEVWHACYLCGQLVLLDNDHLGSHIKSAHKLAEKTYKDQYIVSRYTQSKNTKAQHQDCEGNKRGDEKEMSKTRAGGGGKNADVVAQRRRRSVKRRDASMMKNKQKELKRKVGLKEKQERLQVEKKIVKKVNTSASMVAEIPKLRSARKTVKKLSIGNSRGQSRSLSSYYRSLTASRQSQRRPRTRGNLESKVLSVGNESDGVMKNKQVKVKKGRRSKKEQRELECEMKNVVKRRMVDEIPQLRRKGKTERKMGGTRGVGTGTRKSQKK